MSAEQILTVAKVYVEILKQSIKTLREFHERLEIITSHTQIFNPNSLTQSSKCAI